MSTDTLKKRQKNVVHSFGAAESKSSEGFTLKRVCLLAVMKSTKQRAFNMNQKLGGDKV